MNGMNKGNYLTARKTHGFFSSHSGGNLQWGFKQGQTCFQPRSIPTNELSSGN